MLPVSENAPGNLTHHGMCYLQKQNKVLLAPNKKDGKTWLFDPETAKWSMSDAQGDPPELGLPLVYDPVSGTALAFIAKNSGTIIWQYDPEKNLWQKIDSPVDLSPHHTSMDVCYDPKNNVFIMDGGLVTWLTDHIAVREIWTYRFKNRPAETENVYEAPLMAHDKPGYPQNVIVSVKANGTVQLDWDPVNGQDIQGYHVYAATVKTGDRLHHKQTFAGKSDDFCLTDRPIKNCRFIDKNKLSSDEGGLFKHEIRAYYVKAVNSDGIESGPSATVLSLPGIVQSVKVEQRTDGSNHISWQPSPEADLRGYAVYRMDEIMPSLPFRLNPTPIKGCEYIDWNEAPKAERQRYYVVALDALDEEGLPSNGAWAFGRP
jgi:hypothetical protein